MAYEDYMAIIYHNQENPVAAINVYKKKFKQIYKSRSKSLKWYFLFPLLFAHFCSFDNEDNEFNIWKHLVET